MFKQTYNIEPEKVILVGDSAGGNLVASLTNLLITFKQRIPDGIVLVYPALNLNYNNYTPSLLTSLNDMILPHTFLKICLKAYLIEGTDAKNMYVSPINTPDDHLKLYPPTRIFVGNRDPFHDDCCRLT
jgi:hormone-sensitive lipase